MLLLPLVYTAVPIWLSCLCPFSVSIAATFVDSFVFPEQCPTICNSFIILFFNLNNTQSRLFYES